MYKRQVTVAATVLFLSLAAAIAAVVAAAADVSWEDAEFGMMFVTALDAIDEVCGT